MHKTKQILYDLMTYTLYIFISSKRSCHSINLSAHTNLTMYWEAFHPFLSHTRFSLYRCTCVCNIEYVFFVCDAYCIDGYCVGVVWNFLPLVLLTSIHPYSLYAVVGRLFFQSAHCVDSTFSFRPACHTPYTNFTYTNKQHEHLQLIHVSKATFTYIHTNTHTHT